jgi:hypothetical protein
MVLSRMFEPPDLLVATVGGLVTEKDQAGLVSWVRDTLETIEQVRLLIRLDRFEGWRADACFSDPTLWLNDDEGVAKMAIVGSPEWRLATLTFIVQPLRRTPIEYFETEAAARRWLGVDVRTHSDAGDQTTTAARRRGAAALE